jgi:hypothetical protein
MRARMPVVIVVALALAGSGCATIVRSSTGFNGAGPNAASSQLDLRSISDDGRYVAFGSAASNVVASDTNGAADVFRRDNRTGTTIRVSVDGTGAQFPLASTALAISGDGDHVAFRTDAALEPADTNGVEDVYVRSVSTGETERVSIRPDGTPIATADVDGLIDNVTFSHDGRIVGMLYGGHMFGTIFVRDRVTHTTTMDPRPASGVIVSNDGSAYARDQYCPSGPCPGHAIVQPLAGGNGEIIDPVCGFIATDVSGDARFVVGLRYAAYPTFDCPDAGFVRWDRTTGQFAPVPFPTPYGSLVSISNNGRFVGALGEDGAVRIVDLATGITQIVDPSPGGPHVPDLTRLAAMSGSGRYFAFTSTAPLVPEDTDSFNDVYTRYAVQPGVSGVTPGSAAQGAHRLVTITGTEFLPGAAVSFSGSGITVHSVTVESSTTLRVELSIDAGAPAGPRDVVVSNRVGFGHADGWCPACLTVT